MRVVVYLGRLTMPLVSQATGPTVATQRWEKSVNQIVNNAGRRSPVRALTLLVAMLLLTSGFSAFVGTKTAHALCASPAIVGSWRNIDANTNSVTRVDVGLHCGDVILCDTNGNCSGGETYFTTRPFGKCHPTDCDWSVRRADSMGDGWYRSVYTQTWATKYVWIKTYSFYGSTYLRVYVVTDFTAADGRTDYTSDVWMLK